MENLGFDAGGSGMITVMDYFTETERVLDEIYTKPDPAAAYEERLRPYENAGLSTFDLLSHSEREEWSDALWGESRNQPDGNVESHVLSNGVYIEWHIGGCAGKVNRALFMDDIYGYHERMVFATGASLRDWRATPEVESVHMEWASCMGSNGFSDLADPEDALFLAVDLHQGLVDPHRIYSGEDGRYGVETALLILAEVDAACHDEAGVESVQEEVFFSLLLEEFSEHEAEVFAFAEEARDILSRAQEMLSLGRLEVE
jgi:hypothetical protein